MTVPQNPNDVVIHLGKLSRELEDVTNTLNARDIEATILDEDVTCEEAKAFVAATGAEGLRKAKSKIATHELRLKAKVAAAEVRGYSRTMRTLTTRIEVGRSTGAAVRTELQTLNYGGGA